MDSSEFKIIMSSDEEYNELCAEIFFQNQFVAILTQEKGLENLEIEIHSPVDRDFWVFRFAEFENALQSAKKALWQMQKIPEEQ